MNRVDEIIDLLSDVDECMGRFFKNTMKIRADISPISKITIPHLSESARSKLNVPTFDELLKKKPKDTTERLLLACLCTLSTSPQFSGKTPWEIYERIIDFSEELEF